MRKLIYLFLSLIIVFANTQTAFAASSWSITSAASAGARTVVSASKAGYKSAVNVAPTAGRLALKLGKGANWAALVYAAIQLAPDLADISSFQPDYSNNRVRYKIPAQPAIISYITASVAATKASSPSASCSLYKAVLQSSNNSYAADLKYENGKCISQGISFPVSPVSQSVPEKIEYISIPAVASKVISNANAGHAASQAATRETATEMVIGGQFDADLLAGAVPTNDTKPLVPSVPISGNGNQSYGGVGVGDGADDGMSGATPGEQSDAAKDAAEAAKNAADAAKDAAKAASEQAAKDAADAQDLINSAADQAAIDAANDRAKAAEQAAKGAKDVADAAVAAADARAKAAEKAAEKATEAAKEAAEKAAKDVADAKAAGDDAAVAAAEKAKEAADKAVADAKEKQAAAERAADKAKAEAAKPFELPAFCSWAAIVCDTAEWLKREPVIDESSGDIEVQKQDETMHEGILERLYIDMPAQCPADPVLEFMGAKIPFPMSVFCQFASMMKPLILLFAYIKGLSIIGNGLT